MMKTNTLILSDQSQLAIHITWWLWSISMLETACQWQDRHCD